MDSLTTAQLLRDSQQFYSDSFQDLLTLFCLLVTILFGWKLWDFFRFNKRLKTLAQKEAKKVKEEMESQIVDFKVYTKIAFAITKFRDSKATKDDLKVFINLDYTQLSNDTIQVLVHAVRFCVDCLEDDDFDLAKKVDDYIRPLAKKLNAGNRYNIYGALANQILMRTHKIMTGKFYGEQTT